MLPTWPQIVDKAVRIVQQELSPFFLLKNIVELILFFFVVKRFFRDRLNKDAATILRLSEDLESANRRREIVLAELEKMKVDHDFGRKHSFEGLVEEINSLRRAGKIEEASGLADGAFEKYRSEIAVLFNQQACWVLAHAIGEMKAPCLSLAMACSNASLACVPGDPIAMRRIAQIEYGAALQSIVLPSVEESWEKFRDKGRRYVLWGDVTKTCRELSKEAICFANCGAPEISLMLFGTAEKLFDETLHNSRYEYQKTKVFKAMALHSVGMKEQAHELASQIVIELGFVWGQPGNDPLADLANCVCTACSINVEQEYHHSGWVWLTGPRDNDADLAAVARAAFGPKGWPDGKSLAKCEFQFGHLGRFSYFGVKDNPD